MSLGYQLLYWVIKVIACSAYDIERLGLYIHVPGLSNDSISWA